MIDFELFENDKGMREVHLAGVYVCCRLQPWCNSWKQLLISEVEAVELSSAQRMTDDWVFDLEKSYLIITFLLSFTSDSALIDRTFFFNWSITALQCCVSFCCTAWISYKCTSVIFSFASLLFPSDYFLLFLVEDNTHPSLYAFQTNSVDEKVLYGSVFECIYSMHSLSVCKDFPGGSDSKESCNAGGMDLIPGLGRSSWWGHGDPLQHSCLENPHGQRSLEDYRLWGCIASEMSD